MSIDNRIKLVSGSHHQQIALEIAENLGVSLTPVSLSKFANGEINFSIMESVRGDDVFVIQSHSEDVNSAIIEQAIMIDCAKRASASSITAVCPFMAYCRQDRKSSGREAISAKLLVDILSNAGADRIMTIDLHTGQIQGFMNGPFDHLIARPVLVQYIKDNFLSNELVIVSPDAGRVKSADRYANELGCDLAIIHKHRSGAGATAEARHLIGDIVGKVCFIVDDMIDTAGTLCAAAGLLEQNGAKEIYGIATHGLFSGEAIQKIEKSSFKKVIVTNTLPHNNKSEKIEVLSVSKLLADSISAVNSGSSVSAIFNESNQF